MGAGDWVGIAVVAVLFVLSGILAMAETAFTRTTRVRALALEEDGDRRASRLARMLETPERTLNPVLLVLLTGQLVSATLVGAIVEERLGLLGFVLGLVIEVSVFFVFFEVAPKTYAIQHSDRAALRLSGLLWFLTNFTPIRWISTGLIGVANIVLPGRGIKRGPYVTEEDVRAAADVAAEEEAIEREERRLIHSIFEFGDTVVREVMLPRPDMVAVEANETVEQAIGRAIDGGFSRLPVYEGDTDHIVGLVYLKDLVERYRRGQAQESVGAARRDAIFVPEQKRVAELLREMQQQQFHMAVVVDEHGGTAGLVTLEDLLEEIVGEIADEYDVEEPGVEHLPGGGLRVPGRTPIDDVNEELEIELPDDEWDTVGGLVFNLLGKVPDEGETVRFQGYEFRAERVQGNRIVSVEIRPTKSRDGHIEDERAGERRSVAP